MFAVVGLLINGNDFSRLGEIKTVQASLGPIGNTIAALMLILFSFIGWDRVGYVAGEMKDPQKVAKCIDALKNNCSLPVTIKHRIGVDNNDSFTNLKSYPPDHAFWHAHYLCLVSFF